MHRMLCLAAFVSACSGPGTAEPPKPTDTAGKATPPATPEAPKPVPPEVKPGPLAKDDEVSARAAMKAATGKEPSDDACFNWPDSFPSVVVIGSFANDRGCEDDGLLIDRRFVTTNGDVLGLATVGFAAADAKAKEKLARAWVDEVYHAFGYNFVTEADPAFGFEGSPAFTAVAVRTAPEGVVVEGWEREPSGMVFESAFRYATYRVAADGKVSSEFSKAFAVPGERLRDRKAAPAPVTAVDMTKYDLKCKVDGDCTHVRPSPCGSCGCENTPLLARDLEAFRTAAAAIVCPPPSDLERQISCGGCPGYQGFCDKGRCAVRTR